MRSRKSAQSNSSKAVLWLVDDNGRRTFPVAKDARAEIGEGVRLPGVKAMAGILTTMRAQASLRQ